MLAICTKLQFKCIFTLYILFRLLTDTSNLSNKIIFESSEIPDIDDKLMANITHYKEKVNDFCWGNVDIDVGSPNPKIGLVLNAN